MSPREGMILEKWIRGITNVLAVVGAAVLFLMMVIGAADVLGRYFFNRPIEGSMEISSIMMATASLLGLAYALVKGAHVSVEMVITHFPRRFQLVVDLICTALALAFFAVVAWQATVAAVGEWASGRVIDVIYVPLAPLYLLVTLGTSVLCLELMVRTLHIFSRLRKVG